MTNLESILKDRDITLLTKVCMVKAMVFSAVMCGCESWTIKNLSAKELMLSNYGAGKAIALTAATAAAAKSLQSCPTLCDPIDGSPLGSPVPGILQARTLEWVAISFSSA